MTLPALIGIGVLALIVLLDGLRASSGIRGLGILLDPIVRMSKDRPVTLEMRIRNEPLHARTVRVAIGLPSEIRPEEEELSITLPAGAEWSRVPWKCVPLQRGRFRVESAYVEGRSPLGLWAARKRVDIDSELRVYPNLMTERRNLAALFLNRGGFGLHAQRQVGKGRDFEKLRDYSPGDSFDDIHWKATARRGRPVTKVFQVERTQEVYVVIDASRLSARRPLNAAAVGDSEKSPGHSRGESSRSSDSILERFVTAALVLGLAAEQQGDLFGLLTFSDRVDRFVRARNGKAHYSACRDTLYTLQARNVTPDFDELCTFIRLRLRRRALIVFLTSLDDPTLAEGFVGNVELIRRQHLVLVGMIQPPGTRPLFSTEGIDSADALYEELGGHLQWARLQEVGKTLQRQGVRFALMQNERLSSEVITQYLNIKRRQLL